MINKLLIIPAMTILLIFIGGFFVFPTDAFACHGTATHQDHIVSDHNIWKESGQKVHIGKSGPGEGPDEGAYDNLIFTNLEPGRYEVTTHGNYGGQSDEHMIIVASDGDVDEIPDLDGDVDEPHTWLWGQGTVDMCEQNGSITVRAYSQISPAVCSLDVDEVNIVRIGNGSCPIVAQCSVSPTTADVGENVTWTATASGGDGTHNYTWSGNVSGTAVKTSQDKALNFDGTNDYVNVPDQDYFTQAPFTVVASVKFDILPSDAGEERETFVSKQHINQFPHKSWVLRGRGTYNDKFEFAVVDSGKGWNSVRSDAPIIINTWYHAVAILDENYNMELYINGIKQADTDNSGSIFNSTESLTIGGELSEYGMTDGIVNDVYFYSRALSESEVEDLYDSVPVSSSGLVGHWKFDEGSGTTASDSSGSGNTANLINNPQWVAIGSGGTSYSVDTSYLTAGEKIGQITVISDGQSSTASCSNSVFVGESKCSNSVDDDLDGFIDVNDSGCYDTGEYNPDDDEEINIRKQCSNFFDDDGDGDIDANDINGCYDSGSYDPLDDDETTFIPPIYQCADGVNNDYPEDSRKDTADPGCYTTGSYDPLDDDETDEFPQCSNFFDDDGDGFIDTADPDCSGPNDNQELNIKFDEL